jgi:hypothetical protein
MKQRLLSGTMFSAIILVTSLFFYSSCDIFNLLDNLPSRNIIISSPVELVSETVSTSGGTISVAAPGSSIDGMEIVVPQGSFATLTDFNISTSEITSHSFGNYFIPATPLITIDNGGSYAEKVMEITIPLNIPEGHIPIGFFYDKISGKLRGIPFKDYTSSSITLLTRHFISDTELYSGVEKEKSKSAMLNDNAVANIVICHIDQEELENKSVVTSGFQPGTDDWEFPNWCSYTSPGGICYGMSITAIWYYHKRQYRGGKALYHQFDTYNSSEIPKEMWQDNPLGYRFASVIQEESNYMNFVSLMEQQFQNPKKVFYNFIYLLLVTNEPQVVCVRDGETGQAHAMIVYKANMREGQLFISDPNFPNNREPFYGVEVERTIDFANGAFKPYEIGAWAGAPSTSMEQIAYFGESEFIDWFKIGEQFGKFSDESIGNDKFPAYTIKTLVDKEYKLLEDGYTSPGDTLQCVVECPGAELTVSADGMKLIGYTVFRDDKEIYSSSNGIDPDDASPKYLLLEPGVNNLGFFIYGRKKIVENNVEVERPFYMDFKWIKINNSALTILPNPLQALPGQEIMLTASSGIKLPDDTKYVWSFGDGTPQMTVKSDSTVLHTFAAEGKFQVKVELYHPTSNQKIDEATALATISNATETISLGSISLKIKPEATSSGTVTIQHFSNKLIASKSVGTYTYTAEINWLTPPSGNFEVSEGKLFMTQKFDFKFNVSSSTGNASFPGCEIRLWGLETNSSWYRDWEHLNESTVGFYSEGVQKNMAVTMGKSSAETQIEMPVVMVLGNGGGEAYIDGIIEFKGFISNFWSSGDNIPFVITYTYKD